MLDSAKLVLTWLCMLPANDSTPEWKKRAYFAAFLSVNILNIACAISQLTYFLQFKSIDIEGSVLNLLGVVGPGAVVYVSIIAFSLRQKIHVIFQKFTAICDGVHSVDLIKHLKQANINGEFFWGLFFKYVEFGMISTPVLAVVSILVGLLTNNLEVDNLYHSFHFVLPFNQSTYWGYFGETTFNTITCGAFFIVNGTVMVLFISICLYHKAFYEVFEHSLKNLDSRSKVRRSESIICGIIRFRSSTQDWFAETVEVYSPFAMVVLVSSTCDMAIVAFEIDLQIQHVDDALPIIITALSINMCILFAYCFYGELSTESYLRMSDALYESNWLSLPVAIQKYWIIMIANAQRTHYYHGFKIANLDLRTYIKLIRTVFTYYMAFKAVTSV